MDSWYCFFGFIEGCVCGDGKLCNMNIATVFSKFVLQTSSPFGSRESLSSLTVDNQSAKTGEPPRNWNEEQMVPAVGRYL